MLDEWRKLDVLELNQIQRNILYLNQRYWLRSPRSLKLLSWRVKTKRNSTHVHAIRDAAGRKQRSISVILKSFQKYYSKLYSTCNPNLASIRDFLNTYFSGKFLSQNHVDFLEEPATPDEVLGIINSLKNNKTPGRDGFGAEFYKAYAEFLAPPLSQNINEAFALGKIPQSWNKAAIVVLPKQGQDPLDLRSYRPISLLNQDYKIFSTLTTKRLKGHGLTVGFNTLPSQRGS